MPQKSCDALPKMVATKDNPSMSMAALEKCLQSWESELHEMDLEFEKREGRESQMLESSKRAVIESIEAERVSIRPFGQINASLLARLEKLWSRKQSLQIQKLEREYEQQKNFRKEAFEHQQLRYLEEWAKEISALVRTYSLFLPNHLDEHSGGHHPMYYSLYLVLLFLQGLAFSSRVAHPCR